MTFLSNIPGGSEVRASQNTKIQPDFRSLCVILPTKNFHMEVEWPRSHYFVKIAITDLCLFKIGTRSERYLD